MDLGRLLRRAVSTAALAVVMLPAAGRAGDPIDTSATAHELAVAMAVTPSQVTGATFDEFPDGDGGFTPVPTGVSNTALAGLPVDGQTFAIMTTGDASLADDLNHGENYNPEATVDNGGGPRKESGGATDADVVVLKVDLDVPDDRNCLSIDFKFLSEEYPEFVNSEPPANDAFIAELDKTTWTTSGSTISAPDNFAFDPSGDVISINSSGETEVSAAEARGTVYDGSTPLLRASTQVTRGAHSLYLSIFDQGDHHYDSAVFLDRIFLGATTGDECEEGTVVPVPCEPPTLEGTEGSDKLTGTSGEDWMKGYAGRDSIDGLAGKDELCGGPNPDYLYGRDAGDMVLAGGGNDRAYGGGGSDTLRGGARHDLLSGGAGADVIDAKDGQVDCIRKDSDDIVTRDANDLVNPTRGCDPGFWLR